MNKAEQEKTPAQGIWCGKMCPELSAPTKEPISASCSKKPQKWPANKPPLFLSLKTDGLQPDALPMWEDNGALRGEYLTHSFGVCPKDENASHLSQILEVSPHPKYSLSARACLGILNRAEKRGKQLPEILKLALIQQAQRGGLIAYKATASTEPTPQDATESGTNMVPSVLCLNDQGGSVMNCSENVSGTLRAQEHGHQPLVYENHGIDSRYTGPHKVAPTMSARYGTGGNNVPLVEQEADAICIAGNTVDRQPQNGGNGLGCQVELAYTLTATDRHCIYARQRVDVFKDGEVASTQSARQHKDATDLVVDVAGLDCRNAAENGDLCGTLQKGTSGSSLNSIHPIRNGLLIRRLTPLECERLQGFPDGWTDIGEWTDSKGKVHKESTDSARYKALGNSIAIPPWTYVLQRLSLCCGAKPTMASLFDGIGGFPYIWESLNGKGSCVWASEIEDFPIAVTKYHFPEEANNDG